MGDVPASVGQCLNTIELLRSVALRTHECGVGRLCRALGSIMGIEPGLLEKLQFAAELHDIGKVTIPDAIVLKPAVLDPAEWAVMRRHAELGFDILKSADDPTISLAAVVALHHHECWDGSGYPAGLSGEAIPREVRLVGICDIYQALREPRPYRTSMGHDQVMQLLLIGDSAGRTRPSLFDPELLSTLNSHSELVRSVYEEPRR